MKSLLALWRRLCALFQSRALKHEIDEELRFHLEQRTAENIAAGMSPADAARDARKRFGNLQSVREDCRDVRGASFGEETWRDVRFACRHLRKHPGFTAAIVLTLALGLGVNVAMFSFLDRLLFRPPTGVNKPGELVRVYPNGWWSSESRSYPDYADLRDGTSSFAGVAAYQARVDGALGQGGDAIPVRLARATASFFPVLGVVPAAGRFFTEAEDGAPDAEPVAVLSHEFWQRQFAGAADVLVRSLWVGK